jgi:hypothetical protein
MDHGLSCVSGWETVRIQLAFYFCFLIQFQQYRLPQFPSLAQSLGVDLHVVEAGKGSPSAIGITPLTVY